MAYKSYTKCVNRNDYENPNFLLEAALVVLGTLGFNPIPIALGAFSAIEKVLDYMLNKKLVCLGGDRCSIGRIVGFETVEDKSFPDNIDNDFSINLMLYPSSLDDFIGKSLQEGWVEAKLEIQGEFITEQKDMPEPRSPIGGKVYHPYPMEPVDIEDAYAIGGFNTFFPLKTGVNVPIFHVECEGSRIHDLLKTLQDIESLGLGKAFCDIPILGWIVCAIVKLVLAPIIAAVLTIAWFLAEDGNPDDARIDPEAGELALGDLVVVTGRWVYDAGHEGWNELHPVKTIQKIGGKATYPPNPESTVNIWCERTSEIPPPDRHGPGGVPTNMTPRQKATWEQQREPENRWVIHPMIDGCLSREQDLRSYMFPSDSHK